MRKGALVVVAAGLVGGAATLVSSSRVTAEDGPKFTVEVVGVRTCGAPYKDLSPFNNWPGVAVALLVKAEGCQVTGMDSSSRVKEIGDDTGGDLFVGGGDSRQTSFGQMPQLAKDASAILVEVDNPKCPTKGAKSIHLEGKLVLNTANGTEQKKAECKLAEGEKFEMAGLSIQIEKAGDSGWEEMPLQITLKSNKSFETIADWKLQDEAGADVKTQVSGHWSFGSGNEATHQLILNVGKKLAKGTFVCECRKDLKKANVPFKLDVGIGF